MSSLQMNMFQVRSSFAIWNVLAKKQDVYAAELRWLERVYRFVNYIYSDNAQVKLRK
jgi:hypothetical protein